MRHGTGSLVKEIGCTFARHDWHASEIERSNICLLKQTFSSFITLVTHIPQCFKVFNCQTLLSKTVLKLHWSHYRRAVHWENFQNTKRCFVFFMTIGAWRVNFLQCYRVFEGFNVLAHDKNTHMEILRMPTRERTFLLRWLANHIVSCLKWEVGQNLKESCFNKDGLPTRWDWSITFDWCFCPHRFTAHKSYHSIILSLVCQPEILNLSLPLVFPILLS